MTVPVRQTQSEPAAHIYRSMFSAQKAENVSPGRKSLCGLVKRVKNECTIEVGG